MAKVSFVITAEVPDGATVTDAKQYIRDALGSWGGSFHPDDALFKGLICTVRSLGSPQSIGNRAAAIADQVAADHRAQAKRYKEAKPGLVGEEMANERFVNLHITEANVAEYVAKEIRTKLGSTT